MTDYVDVVETSPITFVKTVTEKLSEGYHVANTIPGYPQFGLYGSTVRLFKAEQPPSGVTVAQDGGDFLAEHYDPMHFFLLIEAAVRAGYKFKDGGQHFFDEKGLKSIQLEKAEEKPAPAKKVTKGKATLDITKED